MAASRWSKVDDDDPDRGAIGNASVRRPGALQGPRNAGFFGMSRRARVVPIFAARAVFWHAQR
jgi:hypothetical protein